MILVYKTGVNMICITNVCHLQRPQIELRGLYTQLIEQGMSANTLLDTLSG